MLLRLTRYRLRSEWARILLGLFFAGALYFWAGWINPMPVGRYGNFVATYGELSPEMIAKSLMIDPSEASGDLREMHRQLLIRERGAFWHGVIMGTDYIAAWPVSCALSVLFLTGLFQKRRVGPWLSAGYGRGRSFLSLTLVYYGSVLLVWVVASRLLINAYRIAFSPEEQDFYRTTQLNWLCSFLFRASVLYMSSMLFRRPFPAAAAGLGVCLLLLLFRPVLPFLPLRIAPNARAWNPGADLTNAVSGNITAAGVFVLSIAVGWLSFRKRGME